MTDRGANLSCPQGSTQNAYNAACGRWGRSRSGSAQTVLGLKPRMMTWESEAAHTPTWVGSMTDPAVNSLNKASRVQRDPGWTFYAGKAAVSTC
jgi:hypothetical protein